MPKSRVPICFPLPPQVQTPERTMKRRLPRLSSSQEHATFGHISTSSPSFLGESAFWGHAWPVPNEREGARKKKKSHIFQGTKLLQLFSFSGWARTRISNGLIDWPIFCPIKGEHKFQPLWPLEVIISSVTANLQSMLLLLLPLKINYSTLLSLSLSLCSHQRVCENFCSSLIAAAFGE